MVANSLNLMRKKSGQRGAEASVQWSWTRKKGARHRNLENESSQKVTDERQCGGNQEKK
jgi:hypothetical protein